MQLQNSNISLPFSNEIRQQGTDVIKKIQDTIIPVYPIHKKYADNSFGIFSTTTADATVFTTPVDRDFYISSAHLSIVKDVVCDNVTCYFYAKVNSKNLIMLSFLTPTTTITAEQSNASYPFPIKVDRGTAIVLSGAFTAGTMTKYAFITGFLI